MYPNLSYLFHDCFNTPFDNWTSVFKTYGISLAITFGICSMILKNELKRRELEGLIKPISTSSFSKWSENIFLILISAIIGYKMVYIGLNIDAFKLNSRDLVLSWQGNVLGSVFFTVCSMFIVYYGQEQSNKDTTTSFSELNIHLSVVVVIFSLIGNKLFGIFEVNFEQKTIAQIFNESGTNFLGGLSGGLLGGYIFCRIYKIPFNYLLDSIAPIMMIGYAIGRVGCHLSGDGCWGIDNNSPKPKWFIFPDWLWAYSYPHNVADKGINIVNTLGKHNKILENPVFPTSLYEALFGFIMFLIFWKTRKTVIKPYILFIYFLFSIGIERFLIEFVRINNKYYFIGLYLSQAQFISLLLIICSISVLLYMTFSNKYKQNTLLK